MFLGKSVYKAIHNVKTELADLLIGRSVSSQEEIDKQMCELDGTENKSRLGANAILSVSLAVADARAKLLGLPLFRSLSAGQGNVLPLPEIKLVGGGAHAQSRTDIQDFLLIVNGAKTYEETLEVTYNVYHAGEKILKRRGLLARARAYFDEFITQRRLAPDNHRSIQLSSTYFSDSVHRNRIA